MRERPLDAGMFVIFSVLLLGLASRAADDGGAVVQNQDVAWIAPMRRRTAADVDYDVAGDALVRPEDEDALGVRGGELAAAGRRGCLIQHRRALRGGVGPVNFIHLIGLPVVPHAMDLGGVGENTIGLVAPAPFS